MLSKIANLMSIDAINEAIVSGEFLVYDATTQSYGDPGTVRLLTALRDNIVQARRLENWATDPETALLKIVADNNPREYITVRNQDLIRPLTLYDRYDNITRLAKAALIALGGKDDVPMPPVTDPDIFALGFKAPTSVAEVREWVNTDDAF